MTLEQIKRGMRVVITAKDHFYAYVDGWTGYVDGLNNGAVQISAKNLEGRPVVLFVPADQLRAIP